MDAVARGEIEVTVRWRFNPDFVVEKKKKGFLASMGSKALGRESDTEEEANEEEGEVICY